MTRGTAIAVGRARRRAPRSCIIYTRNCGFGYIKKAIYKFHNNFAFIILEIAIHQWRKWTKTPQAYLMYLMYLMQKLYHRVLSFESGKTHFSRFFHVFDSPNGEKRSSWGADFGVIGKPIAIFLIAVYCSHFDISVSTKHSEKTRF